MPWPASTERQLSRRTVLSAGVAAFAAACQPQREAPPTPDAPSPGQRPGPPSGNADDMDEAVSGADAAHRGRRRHGQRNDLRGGRIGPRRGPGRLHQ